MSTIPAWARRGQKVVCIAHPIGGGYGNEVWPEKDQVYTIREVRPELSALLTEEIVNAPQDYNIGFSELLFSISGFRPVVTRTAEQDIAEHFADLLKVDAPEGVAA